MDVGRGPVATVLVQNGTLRLGDIFVVGEQWGKVRALINDSGRADQDAGPSSPVEVLGLNGTPEAGDVLNVTETEAQAREIAEYRAQAAKDKRAAAGAATTLEQLMANAKANEDISELPILGESRRSGLCGSDRAGDGENRQRRSPGAGSCTLVLVRSQKPISDWPKPLGRRCLALTCGQMPQRGTQPTKKASRFAIIR